MNRAKTIRKFEEDIIKKYEQDKKDKKFVGGEDELTDLIRGTITVDIKHMIDAYLFFASIEGVKVLRIKEKLKTLQNVTVNFVFKDILIGEMQFRYEEYPIYYHSNHFLYEIDRSQDKIDFIDSLNNKATYLSKHNQL